MIWEGGEGRGGGGGGGGGISEWQKYLSKRARAFLKSPHIDSRKERLVVLHDNPFCVFDHLHPLYRLLHLRFVCRVYRIARPPRAVRVAHRTTWRFVKPNTLSYLIPSSS